MEACHRIYLYRRILQAKFFIDEHFAEEINLNAIAGEAQFSKFHFIKLFKSTYQKTPHQYLISVRIGNAQKLLKKGMLPSRVCYAVGFDSIPSFTSLFKDRAGITPLAYQQQQKNLSQDMTVSPLKYIPNCFLAHCFHDNTTL